MDQSERIAPTRPCGTEGEGPDPTLLARVVTDQPASIRPMYWRAIRHPNDGAGAVRADLASDASIAIGPGTTVTFDTYFGAFFEANWWTRTRLREVELQVAAAGRCTVRVLRRVGDTVHLLSQETIAADPSVPLRLVVRAETASFRQHGMVYFEIAADRGEPARLVRASWHALAAGAPVALGIVVCTFNREPWVGDLLSAATRDAVVAAAFERVVVVNQGTPGLRTHPAVAAPAGVLGERLTVIEQRNLGGAGGFTRGMVETLDDPSLTHVLLLDDDIDLEPDTLVRIRAFLAHADGDVALGGQMLDRIQAMKLYEGGAIIEAKSWFPKPVQHDLDLRDVLTLGSVATPPASHYNGWWCFAVRLDTVRAQGLPLPVFIRGDDAEYGIRLGQAGIDTVTLPGIAVWHEPFYLKLGGWHLYYETRNLLILAALHRDATGAAMARRQLRMFLLHLLTFRYAGAALILRGIEDFLEGPAILDGDPGALHQRVVSLAAAAAPDRMARTTVVEDARLPGLPRGRLGYAMWLAFVLVRSALVPARDEDRRVVVGEFAWVTLRHLDSAVLDNWWEERMPIHRRSRERFLALVPPAVSLLWRLFRTGPAVVAQWRAAAPGLTGLARWRSVFARG